MCVLAISENDEQRTHDGLKVWYGHLPQVTDKRFSSPAHRSYAVPIGDAPRCPTGARVPHLRSPALPPVGVLNRVGSLGDRQGAYSDAVAFDDDDRAGRQIVLDDGERSGDGGNTLVDGVAHPTE